MEGKEIEWPTALILQRGIYPEYKRKMDKRLHLPLTQKSDVGIAKNFQGITFIFIVAKIYYALLLNCIKAEIEKILWKNQNSFQKNRSTTSQILTVCQIIERVHPKNYKAKFLFVNFSKAFDSIHSGKMEEIFLAYGLPKETNTVIIMFYSDMKAKVHSPDWDTDIVDRVLQGDILALYLFIICLDYVLLMSVDLIKENGFTLKKAWSRWCLQKLSDADYANDIVLLANTHTQVESLLHSLKKAAGGIGLDVNADKNGGHEFWSRRRIATLNGSS